MSHFPFHSFILVPFSFILLITHLPTQQSLRLCHSYSDSKTYPQLFSTELLLPQTQGGSVSHSHQNSLPTFGTCNDLRARSASVPTAEIWGSNCQAGPLFSPTGACGASLPSDTASSSKWEVWQVLKSTALLPLTHMTCRYNCHRQQSRDVAVVTLTQRSHSLYFPPSLYTVWSRRPLHGLPKAGASFTADEANHIPHLAKLYCSQGSDAGRTRSPSQQS